MTSMFGGMYLTSLGMIISPAFVWAKVFSIMAITAFVGGSKLLLASAVLGVSLNTTSEVSIAIGSFGSLIGPEEQLLNVCFSHGVRRIQKP